MIGRIGNEIRYFNKIMKLRNLGFNVIEPVEFEVVEDDMDDNKDSDIHTGYDLLR